MNKIRTLVAGALGAAVIVGGSLTASPAQAQAPSILSIVAGSLDNNDGQATDHRWNDFDILANVVGALGLADAVGGLGGATAFAPSPRRDHRPRGTRTARRRQPGFLR